ncbi:hypothetical protein ACHAP6_002619 [Verticillium nonalfalfae]
MFPAHVDGLPLGLTGLRGLRGLAVVLLLGVDSALAAARIMPRDFNPDTDVDLGVLDDLDAFFTTLGTNASDWLDVSPPRTMEVVDVAAAEAWNRAVKAGEMDISPRPREGEALAVEQTRALAARDEGNGTCENKSI